MDGPAHMDGPDELTETVPTMIDSPDGMER
jgi:hypothetical protein